ncbi:phage tail protein [Sphingomonas qomolangmaensis]|uniref:Tail fiber protein n=1 Tax=Sphingomonas qomolangmaensis TaxID=2918765 RepID=A0ABY5L9K8_9SPHN|nr:tail fiber protein [Sphingomonas qomolangmaensis]UUL82455.1 tail fiber protein [Sphingomonas qomolangmaensis]
MSDAFIGEVRLFAGTFAPNGWVLCDGRLLDIGQNDVLYTLLGTAYGGDGVQTFAVPDLRGRVPISQGQGLGLSNYSLGEAVGTEDVTITPQTMAPHAHPVLASTSPSTLTGPIDAVAATPTGGVVKPSLYVSRNGTSALVPSPMDTAAITPNGGNQPHDNMMPFVAINYIMATVGIFPSRN